jgi:hypothetical protein
MVFSYGMLFQLLKGWDVEWNVETIGVILVAKSVCMALAVLQNGTGTFSISLLLCGPPPYHGIFSCKLHAAWNSAFSSPKINQGSHARLHPCHAYFMPFLAFS